MDDATRQDLAALADGTLEPEARESLLRRIEASPELADALLDQHDALIAIRATQEEEASPHLRAAVEAMAAERNEHSAARGRRRTTPRFFARRRAIAFGSSLATLAAAAAVLFSAGASGPSVAEAAQVALAPPRAPAPAVKADEKTLDAAVDGVAYPYWADATGWRAVGSRTDAVDGRAIRTVVYQDAHGRRIGYAIAAGSPLSAAHGTRHGDFTVVRSGNAAVVTWLRDGHTCILAARGVGARVLLKLAAWD
jgi:anti-sigma factor RsiW